MQKLDESKHVLISWEKHAEYEEAVRNLDEISRNTANAIVIQKNQKTHRDFAGGFYQNTFWYDIKIMNHNEVEENLKTIIDLQAKEMEAMEERISGHNKAFAEIADKLTYARNELSGLFGRIFFKSLRNKL